MAYNGAEVADGTESKQLAEVTTAAHKEGDFVVMEYTRLDLEVPKTGVPAKTFIKGINPELETKLKALKVGDKTVVVKTKKGNFWNFTGLEDSSTFVPREKKKFTPGGGKAPYDQVGAKVGGILHDASALAIASHGTSVSVSHVADIAREMLTLSITLEAEVRSGSTTPSKPIPKTVEPVISTPVKGESSSFEDSDESIWS